MKFNAFRIAIVFSILLSLTSISEALIWRDEFLDDLDGWVVKGRFSKWETKEGMLKVEIVVKDPCEIVFEQLQLKEIPGPYDDFTVILKNIRCKYSNFGIGLSKLFDVPGCKEFSYLFLNTRIDGRRCGIPFPNRAPYTLWHTYDLKEMRVDFNSGRFRMYVDGEKRADFKDPRFDKIDIIGFAIVGFKGFKGEGWVDSFALFSPAISVEPRGKLAITWGRVKGW